ncbi:MAG: hypothetical protein HY702_02210 [Gemmatimonadetes bacterium]|nr:hypothetical protein [Gemmatimonadota bacterium]
MLRTDAEIPWSLFIVGRILFPLAFAWIYTKGYEPAKAPLGQGIRYGLAVGGVYAGYGAWVGYAVTPLALSLTLKTFLLGIVEMAILGVLVALVYGRRAAPASAG